MELLALLDAQIHYSVHTCHNRDIEAIGYAVVYTSVPSPGY